MRKARPILLGLGLILMLSAACTPSAAPAPSGAVPTAGAADGKALVAARCSVCHSTSRIEGAKKSRAEWEATVSRMKGKGAVLNAVETQAVLAYLAATFK